ncbi:MAG: hypothetical protein ACXWDM_00705 [Nocardioides sp.]
MALLGGTASLTTAPAQSAAVAGDCARPHPVAEVTDGQVVDGLTVSEGTTPEPFTGEVLGVINDGIAPGLDLVMARLTSDEIDRVGIWQGMSGSPVYAEDGRLIGAVAYGLAWGPSPVAGITPFEHMDDYLAARAAPTRITVGDRAARAIAADSAVTTAQASQGFSQLPMPLAFSGLTQKRLAQMKKKGPDYLHTRGAVANGAASAAAHAGPDSLVAGGNLGAVISYGDITAGGVGTVTSVCADRLVGFGHPMTFGGATTLGLMPADAVYVQEDPVGPGFKVANMGLPAGTIDQDRLTGISGSLGLPPEQTDVTSTVTYGARNRTGSTASLVQDYNADITFSQILANHDRVVDAIQPGTETTTYSVSGTDAVGRAFDIDFGDRYTSTYDVAFEGIFEIADVVYVLSRMKGVTVDDITATADVIDDTASYRLRGVEQKRGGQWVAIGRRDPAVITPGKVLRLRATVTGNGVTRVVPLSVDVPVDAKRRGYLEVTGGASSWDEGVYRAKTPAQVEAAIEGMVRNDEVVANLYFFQRGKDKTGSAVSGSQDLVVRGRTYAEVKVRR